MKQPFYRPISGIASTRSRCNGEPWSASTATVKSGLNINLAMTSGRAAPSESSNGTPTDAAQRDAGAEHFT